MALQKTVKDLNLNQVLIIQGTLANNEWLFSYNRFPAAPEVIYTINKKDKDGKLIDSSFAYLSKKARIYVLSEGNVKNEYCDIDYKFWFGE